MRIKTFLLIYIAIFCTLGLQAQPGNRIDTADITTSDNACRFSVKKLIVPSAFISYGIVSLTSSKLKEFNLSTRHETREHIVAGATIDNYMQYAPAAAVYGLNFLGIKGKHDFKDRTMIYAASQLISAAIVLPVKQVVGEKRPDGSNDLSFPSGHTATAFSSAHFMFREYKESNFWLSISGYPIAASTGIYRILNDKHWVGDVVAGAGIGILSTEIAFWLFPAISKWIPGGNRKKPLVILPAYHSKQIGLSIIKTF